VRIIAVPISRQMFTRWLWMTLRLVKSIRAVVGVTVAPLQI
jgi:hypothetical protein